MNSSQEESPADVSGPAYAAAGAPAGASAAQAEGEGEGAAGLVETLRAELEKYKDIALRAVADLDNYRKRVAREKEDAIRYANAGFLERLIPILDNFELGLQAAKGSGSASAVLDGMSMVQKQLGDFLAASGVETVDAQGQKFDPNLHEAIAQEESAEAPEGTVLRQVRKGYRLRERLLRPANVVVAKAASPAVAPTTANPEES